MEPTTAMAREEIRDLVTRYNYFGDAGRTMQQASLFAPGGSLEFVEDDTSLRCVGREEIHRCLDGVKAAWLAESRESGSTGRIFHSVSTHFIETTSATTARGQCYVSLIRYFGLAEWGRYQDEYVLTEGAWLFSSRRAIRDGILSASDSASHG